MNRQTLKKAFKDTLPVMTGYLALGTGFGILAVKNGFTALEALLMSVFIYAGSLQYLGLSLMSAGMSCFSIALSSFFVNARHLLYGLSMFRKYTPVKKAKPYLIFALTDETYSLVCDKNDPAYFLAVSLLDHSYWISGTLFGCLLANLITFNTQGLDFVLTALFIVIFMEQWTATKDSFSALTGLLVTLVCLLIFGRDDFLICSMAFIVLLLSIQGGLKHE